MRLRVLLLAVVLAPLPACERPFADRPAAVGPPGITPAGYVDSVVPREESLRRFQNGLPHPRRLRGGAGSRDLLVRRFIQALSSADTAALAAMAVSPAEFAHLYYEWSPQSLPPYDLSPQLMWFTLEGKSVQDLATALDLLGGRPLRYIDHTCGEPRIEGTNRIHGFCTVRYAGTGRDTLSARLFGLILERQGHFKFLSYGNKL